MDFDEFKNGSDSFEQEYEEYEIYEDRFDHAAREKPGTWDGEVQFCTSVIKITDNTQANMDFLFMPTKDDFGTKLILK